MNNKSFKNLLKSIIPPFILNIFKKKSSYGFFGKYQDWQEALEHSSGYDSPKILEKVKTPSLKIKNGQAAYERDSVVFKNKQYSWPVVAGLLWASSQNNNRLNVLDFGGSLGSSYFQNRDWLVEWAGRGPALPTGRQASRSDLAHWHIVEQENFVKCGKEYFEDEHLKFFDTIEQSQKVMPANVALFSSVIEYLEKPYDILKSIINTNIPCIIFDRTSFFEDLNEPEIITIQKVPPRIYNASYPSWILNQKKLKNFLEEKGYIMVVEFDCDDNIPTHDINASVVFKGFIYAKNNL